MTRDPTAYRAAETRLWHSTGVEPRERFLDLAQTRVRVRVMEIGDGPPVVFVHGANTSGASWATLTARLPGYRCLVIDRPGTGLSAPLPVPLDADHLPAFGDAFIADVLDSLAIDRAHLVATSLGGYIALRTAAAHPDRIDRMVQFSWPVGAPIDHLPAFMRVMGIPGVSRLVASLPANERSVKALFGRLGHRQSVADGRVTDEDIDCYLSMLRHTDTMRNELAPARAFFSPLHGFDRLLLDDAFLATVRAPTRFIWGEHDPFGGRDTAETLVARFPDAELEVLPAGHAPWLDELDRCATSVGEFLAVGATS